MITSCKCGARWSGTRVEHCVACHKTFSSASPGDRHRIGRHGVTEGPLRRVCLSEREMAELTSKAGDPVLRRGINAFGTEVWHRWGENPLKNTTHEDTDGFAAVPGPSGQGTNGRQ